MRPTLLFSRRLASQKALILFSCVLLSTPMLRADAPAQDYAAMQAAAPENLKIKITSVSTTPSPDGDQVQARGLVLSVTRTATQVTGLSKVTLAYAHGTGPTAVPVVEKDAVYTAYLQGGPEPTVYTPAAGAQSFVYNVNWPTPANNIPAGWIAMDLQKHPDTTTFSLQPSGNQYAVIYHSRNGPSGTWPLLANGNPPALLNLYYSLGSAPVQVLVYVAGTMPSGDAAGTILTVERAVIIAQPSEQPLGDALWAVRAPPGNPTLAQPVWTWSQDALTVTNPYQKTIQTITLTSKAPKP